MSEVPTPRLPAEWERQRAVVFAFPRAAGDWAGNLEEVSEALLAAIQQIHAVTPTYVLVSDRDWFAHYAERCPATVLYRPTNDTWMRDYGPITRLEADGSPTLLDFTFNGWGGKFPAELDNAVPPTLREVFPDFGYRRIPEVLEGGAIESDGAGTILTTTTCLLSEGRNDYTTTGQAEAFLRPTLGADRFLWLHHGELIGDDTDAHIDTLVRFLDAETLAIQTCDDPTDPHYAPLRQMYAECQAFRTHDGRPYHLIDLPWPGVVTSALDGRRLPATYANFLLSNGTLFLPQYFGGAGADAGAREVLEQRTDYRIIGVDCQPFLEQHGSLHCMCMQIPEVSPHVRPSAV